MRTILAMTFKDLRLLTRDWMGMFFVLVFPVLLGIFMGVVFSRLAAQFGDVDIGLIDEDKSAYSAEFIKGLRKEMGQRLVPAERDEALQRIRQGKLYGYIRIPKGFGGEARRMLYAPPTVYITVDPSKHAAREIVTAAVLKSMVALADDVFEKSLLGRLTSLQRLVAGVPTEREGWKLVNIELDAPPSAMFQDDFDALVSGARKPFELAFPMAMVWGAIGCAASFAATLVREKNQGTFLRLRAAPLASWRILAGKALACLVAVTGVIVMLIALGLVMGVRIARPAELAVAVMAASYCFVGMMMLLSVFGKTERATDSAAWAVLLVLSMLGGGMVPLEFLPSWIQKAGTFSPVKWFIFVIEGALWRGLTLRQLIKPIIILVSVGTACLLSGWAIFRRSART